MKKNVDMLHGSLLDKIILFALPVAFTGILQQLFNSADIAVVGHFAGKEALAAVGSTSSIINVIINLFTGLSLGGNVLLGNLLGQGDEKKQQTKTALHTIIVLSFLLGVFLLFLGFFLSPVILRLVEPPKEVFPLSNCYLKIYFLGLPFIMVYNFASGALRSKGDSRRPLLVLIISGVVNVILNLWLVISFGLGVAGVAIATVVSNAISSVFVIIFLLKEEEPLHLEAKRLRLDISSVFFIAKIGLPAGLQSTLFSLSNVIMQGAINSLGAAAMAGSAAAVNYEFFSYFSLMGFIQAAVSFTSQNYGAKDLARCKKVLRLCLVCALSCSFVFCSCFVLLRGFFISIYTTDPSAVPYAMIRITTIEALGFLPSIYEIIGGYLRATGHSLLPAIIVLIFTCFFRVYWILCVFPSFCDFKVLMAVQPISWAITGVAMIVAFFAMSKKIKKSLSSFC